MNSCGGLTPPHEVGAQSDGVTPGLPAVMIIISKSLSQTRQTKVRCIFRLEQRLRYYGQLAPPPLLREKVGHFGKRLQELIFHC